MTDRDPLHAFFEAGDVPSADPGFRLSVMEKVAARRFRMELAARLAAGALLAVLALILAPVAGDVLAPLVRLLDDRLALGALVLALVTALAGHALLSRGLRLPLPRLF